MFNEQFLPVLRLRKLIATDEHHNRVRKLQFSLTADLTDELIAELWGGDSERHVANAVLAGTLRQAVLPLNKSAFDAVLRDVDPEKPYGREPFTLRDCEGVSAILVGPRKEDGPATFKLVAQVHWEEADLMFFAHRHMELVIAELHRKQLDLPLGGSKTTRDTNGPVRRRRGRKKADAEVQAVA